MNLSFSQKKILTAILVAALFTYAFLALFIRAMDSEVDHDENQFVASGQLLASVGELPYRDYPYFHMPLLVWIYGGIFHFTDHILLAARTCSVTFAWLTLAVIFAVGWRYSDRQTLSRRLSLAAGLAALLFVNQLFTYTYFRAWNHALPVLLTLLAFLCHWAAASRMRPLFIVSGIVLAMAICTRLTYAPLALPFLIMAWFVPEATMSRRISSVALHASGLLIGLLMILAPVLSAYDAFLFDNFMYNGPINSAYRGEGAHFLPAIWGKVCFFFTLMTHPSDLAFVLTFVFVAVRAPIRSKEFAYPRRFILLLIGFAIFGAMAPMPSFRHYYYPVAALGVIAIALGLLEYQDDKRRFDRGMVILWAAALIASFPAGTQYARIFDLLHPEQWPVTLAHQEGVMIRSYVPSGRVFTMAPIIPMEGGLRIYESFATGPFAWRSAPFLTPAQREHYKYIGQAELPQLLDQTPPDAVLVGYDPKYEAALIDYAQSHGYRPIVLSGDDTLYLRNAPPTTP